MKRWGRAGVYILSNSINYLAQTFILSFSLITPACCSLLFLLWVNTLWVATTFVVLVSLPNAFVGSIFLTLPKSLGRILFSTKVVGPELLFSSSPTTAFLSSLFRFISWRDSGPCSKIEPWLGLLIEFELLRIWGSVSLTDSSLENDFLSVGVAILIAPVEFNSKMEFDWDIPSLSLLSRSLTCELKRTNQLPPLLFFYYYKKEWIISCCKPLSTFCSSIISDCSLSFSLYSSSLTCTTC